MSTNPASVLSVSSNILLFSCSTTTFKVSRRFKLLFGIDETVCAHLWDTIIKKNENVPYQLVHLLWTLFFLKHYPTEDVMALILRKDPKIIRDRIAIMCNYIQSSHFVST